MNDEAVNPDAEAEAVAAAGGGIILDWATERAHRETERARKAKLKADQDRAREALRRRHNPTPDELFSDDWTEDKLQQLVLPPIEWIVADLIHPGLWLCSAPPKIGKSLLMTGLCRAHATGTMFCNYRPTKKGSVLYLDLEGNQRRAKGRQSLVRGDWDDGSPDFHTFFNWPTADHGGLDMIEEAVKKFGITLVVIDIWARFRPSRAKGEDAYTYDIRSFQPIHDMASRLDVTIILVHHNRKQTSEDRLDQLSGSSGLTGSVDGVLQITRARGENEARIAFDPRDGESQELAAKFSGGLWTIMGPAAEYFAGETRKAIYGLLDTMGRRGGMSVRAMCDELNMKPNSIRATLRRMLKDGVLDVTAKQIWSIRPNS